MIAILFIVVCVVGIQGFRLSDGKTVSPEALLTLELDGFHAPLTAGNFAALVNDKFYDGLEIQKVLELFVQTGKPSDQVLNYYHLQNKSYENINCEDRHKIVVALTILVI